MRIAGGGGIGYLLTQKYEVDAGAAHSTTVGLMLGIANGALLIEPTGWDRSESAVRRQRDRRERRFRLGTGD